MQSRASGLTRRVPAFVAVAALLLLLALDYTAFPPDPYRAPTILALGSGAPSSGGFCGALPD